MRSPEDVIRIKVIHPPLVSKKDFHSVQRLLESKECRHWKKRPDYRSRFAFNGFLRCGRCGARMYTLLDGGMDFYICKNRRYKLGCNAPYQRRERLEEILEQLFAKQVTNRAFLDELVVLSEVASRQNGNKKSIRKAESRLRAFQQRRQQVLDSYAKRLFGRWECHRRLQAVPRDPDMCTEILLRESASKKLSRSHLSHLFSPFFKRDFLDQDQKRYMLASMVAAIHVEGYWLSAISMSMDSRPPALGPVAWVPLSVGAPSACSTGGDTLYIRLPGK